MLRLEQLRAEILERVERLDRRTGQMELRLIRVDQRVDELIERVMALRAALEDERSAMDERLSEARKVN
jgi:hypothetical protein